MAPLCRGSMWQLWVADRNLHLGKIVDLPTDAFPALTGVIFFACLSIILNSVDIYAAVRKSVTATKISLVFYFIGLVLFAFGILVGVWVYIFGTGETRELLIPVDIQFVLSAIYEVVYGWSLLVLLRDARGQARDKWGRLLNYKNGELESAGPIRL
ncbi:hypothetical protein BGX26_007158 [Mortierella sp. AD094]|nr:hypothetical protein BGX26_007158 [Mortierella sp. AD094]